MQIRPIRESNNISCRRGLSGLNKINPIARYANDYLVKMSGVSESHFDPIVDSLKNKIKPVQILKNNVQISGWDINPDNNSDYVLFLHGMSHNITNCQKLYKTILESGKAVFALEYRGYGQNPPTKVSEDRLKKDVENSFEYLTKTKGVKPENIIVLGHSMGGPLAVDLVSKHPNIKSLVLISPITNFAEVSEKFTLNPNIGMGIPKYIKDLTYRFKPLLKLYSMLFNSLENIKKIKTPVYLVHSKNDPITPINGTRKIIKTAKRNGVNINYLYTSKGGHRLDSKKLELVSKIFQDYNI